VAGLRGVFAFVANAHTAESGSRACQNVPTGFKMSGKLIFTFYLRGADER
jgi:hypothetical protein